jgi:hypothetical protein
MGLFFGQLGEVGTQLVKFEVLMKSRQSIVYNNRDKRIQFPSK